MELKTLLPEMYPDCAFNVHFQESSEHYYVCSWLLEFYTYGQIQMDQL